MSAPTPRLPRLHAEDVVGRLEGVRRTGDGRWAAKCPAHGDKGPSLSVRHGEDGRVLLHCFAGCSFTEITNAMGIQASQLFPERDAPWRPTRPRHNPEREARAFFARMCGLRALPPWERRKEELRLVGGVLLGGDRALAALPLTFTPDSLRSLPLKLITYAAEELRASGPSRRWYSPLLIGRLIDEAYRATGHAERLGISGWCRAAISHARKGGGHG